MIPLNPGDTVRSRAHTYTILKEVNKGGFADSYKAKDETGKSIFFKQSKSPGKLVPWFEDYFGYEDELNRRLRSHSVLRNATIYANEVFLAKPCGPDGTPRSRHESIYQAFPFVEGNINLGDMIDRGFSSFDWERRVYACAVFAFALRNLHDANVVHCDLKPENVQIREDPTIGMRYRPLLIDMDWSILSDRQAPWHDQQGYVGTAGYMSPEHMRGEAPEKASDVFTAAIILCQLLADRHPFASSLDGDGLNDAVLSGRHDFRDGISFRGAASPRLGDLLLKALSSEKRERPSMIDIHGELMEMCKALGHPSPMPASPPAPSPVSLVPPTARRLVLEGDAGAFSTGATFRMDQRTLQRVSLQARFADKDNQFTVRLTDGVWSVAAGQDTANATTLNGTVLEGDPAPLRTGDVIALRGRASGKTAMEIRVTLQP